MNRTERFYRIELLIKNPIRTIQSVTLGDVVQRTTDNDGVRPSV